MSQKGAKKKQERNEGFTLIEILLIVAIIGILASIIMSLMYGSAQRKAAINGYKTSIRSVQTAVELCTGANGTAQDGNPGDPVCDSPSIDATYPELPNKCGADTPNFTVFPKTGVNWVVETDGWDCRGCRMECTAEGCMAAAGFEDECE
ncbi:MAG: type II secretion system protein [Candidatus Moranbacteria bacterium]|nr:type II secretion system protein [Candidatus Moranbacteria bacterium]